MTRVAPMIPLAVALDEALKRMERPYWVGETQEQVDFLPLLAEYETALGCYDRWVAGTAADTAAEIADWLSEQGFDTALEDWPNDGTSFGVAGVSNIQVNWVEAGSESLIIKDGNVYPAFDMNAKDGVAYVFRTGAVELRTHEGMIVRIQECDDPGSSIALAAAALIQHTLQLSQSFVGNVFDQVRIPMVSLDVLADLEWLIGLRAPKTGAPDARVVQAKGQTKFGMNQLGAHASEAAAAQVVIESVQVPFEINKPFLLTIGFPGVPPLFGAYITQEHWTDPGDLNTM